MASECENVQKTYLKYTYDEILWICCHVQQSQEIYELISETLRPNKIEKTNLSKITGLLNKLSEQNFKRLLPDILNNLEQNHENGIKLLEHGCLNIDSKHLYTKVLSLITYKKDLAQMFFKETLPFVIGLCKELRELDQRDYDNFCFIQKKQNILKARIKLLVSFANNKYIDNIEFKQCMNECINYIENIELQITFLSVLPRVYWYDGIIEKLQVEAINAPFKIKYKLEELENWENKFSI
jgi:hypothetical protein